MGFWWNKPTVATFGLGRLVTGSGVKDGRAFLFIRPIGYRGIPGQKLPEQIITARRGDIVLWVESEEAARRLCASIMLPFTDPTRTPQVSQPIREDPIPTPSDTGKGGS